MTESTGVLSPFIGVSSGFTQLCDQLEAQFDALNQGKRQRKLSDQQRARASLEALMAAVAIVAMARVPDPRGVPVAFGDHAYVGSELSSVQLRRWRDHLESLGLVTVVRGFNDHSGEGRSSVSRLKPTAALGGLIRQAGIDARDLNRGPFQLLVLNRPESNAPPPADVEASQHIVVGINNLHAQHRLCLPEEAWARIDMRLSQGREFTGISEAMFRVWRGFVGDWTKGGRLYGGFWMNVPREERRYFTIDGEATIELDFRTLHPAILFNSVGKSLDRDPYVVPRYPDIQRDYGKRTFNRLLNGTWKSRDLAHPLSFKAEDKLTFASRERFRQYVRSMRDNLIDIDDLFGRSLGVTLQKLDSDLALRVLEQAISRGMPCYPIHDSFIVRVTDADETEEIMSSSCLDILGFSVPIRRG